MSEVSGCPFHHSLCATHLHASALAETRGDRTGTIPSTHAFISFLNIRTSCTPRLTTKYPRNMSCPSVIDFWRCKSEGCANLSLLGGTGCWMCNDRYCRLHVEDVLVHPCHGLLPHENPGHPSMRATFDEVISKLPLHHVLTSHRQRKSSETSMSISSFHRPKLCVPVTSARPLKMLRSVS